MDPQTNTATNCPHCHAVVPVNSYFCLNCGKVIKTPPPSTSIGRQIYIYFVSLCLWPFGFWYVWKYLRTNDETSKKVGLVCLALTLVSTILTVIFTQQLIGSYNQLVSQYSSLGF